MPLQTAGSIGLNTILYSIEVVETFRGNRMSREQVRSKIRTFLSRPLQGHAFQDNDDIFGLGFIDSLFAMQLVLFIEREFQCRIENEDLDLDNFRTVDAMVQMVEAKLTPGME